MISVGSCAICAALWNGLARIEHIHPSLSFVDPKSKNSLATRRELAPAYKCSFCGVHGPCLIHLLKILYPYRIYRTFLHHELSRREHCRNSIGSLGLEHASYVGINNATLCVVLRLPRSWHSANFIFKVRNGSTESHNSCSKSTTGIKQHHTRESPLCSIILHVYATLSLKLLLNPCACSEAASWIRLPYQPVGGPLAQTNSSSPKKSRSLYS